MRTAFLALFASLAAFGCSDSFSSEDDAGTDIVFDAKPADALPGMDAGPETDGSFVAPDPECGNGIREASEECDDGNDDDSDGCTAACEVLTVCGNGRLEPGEGCDDGDTEDGNGCDAMCNREPFCGDGNIDEGEVCDDGNNRSGDGCRSDCQSAEECGNGIIDVVIGEECDADVEGCVECRLTLCGNDELDEGEQCDDGNEENLDGCSTRCEIERSFVLNSLELGDTSVGCDYSGDGSPDNNFAAALGPLGPLLNMMIGDSVGTQIIVLLQALGLDDPTMSEDDDFTLAWMSGQDADGNESNNTGGMGVFTADTSAFSDEGYPETSFASSVAMSSVAGGPEDVSLPLGFFPVELVQGSLRAEATVAEGSDEVTAMENGTLCGAVPLITFAVLPNPLGMFTGMNAPRCDDGGPDSNLGDVLIGGTPRGFIFPIAGAQPDVDVDGDGLERFEVTSVGPAGCQPVVTACIDGDGTRVEGADCVMDARFEDGWSAGFRFSAVRATIDGTAPIMVPGMMPMPGPTPAP